MRRLPIQLAYCHPGSWSATFGDSLVSLLCNRAVPTPLSLRSPGPYVDRARNTLAAYYLDKSREPWLLMLDVDMVFPIDAPERLLKTAKDQPGVYSATYWGIDRNGREFRPFPVAAERRNGQLHRLSRVPQDAVDVDAVGCGFMLIHRTVLEATRQDGPFPWFQDTIRDGEPVGEDTEFCARAQAAGYPIVLDGRIRLGHDKDIVVFGE